MKEYSSEANLIKYQLL